MRPTLTVAIAVLLLSLFAFAQTSTPPTSNREINRYVIVDGDNLSGSWDSDESPNAQSLRARYGDHFAWFREGGREYIITDAGVMAEIDKAMEPQKKVNALQSDVNQHQSRVNEMQAKVNEHQNAVNALQREVNHRQDIANQVQHAVSNGSNAEVIEKLEAELRELRSKPDVSQSSVNQMQSQVIEEQHAVNDEQAKVNEKQHGVNDQQHLVSADFSQRMNEIFRKALEQGTAQPLK